MLRHKAPREVFPPIGCRVLTADGRATWQVPHLRLTIPRCGIRRLFNMSIWLEFFERPNSRWELGLPLIPRNECQRRNGMANGGISPSWTRATRFLRNTHVATPWHHVLACFPTNDEAIRTPLPNAHRIPIVLIQLPPDIHPSSGAYVRPGCPNTRQHMPILRDRATHVRPFWTSSETRAWRASWRAKSS